MLSTGCAAVPSLPEWQDISAEREARKQDTLQHIDRTRGQAAEIEQASFAKAPHPQAVVPPGRTADRLTPPAGAALEPIAAAVDPSLTADPILNADAVQPTPEQSLRAEADRAVAMGDLEEAIRLYRQLIAKQPKNAELHHALALVAEQMDLHDDASRHYREAMRLAPAEHLYRLCYEAHADRLASETPPGSAVR
jgi:tetratricopeptide (TPR) repeat protein